MSGTREGGKKAALKNLERDPNFYANIGRKGGKNGHTGGFAANPELAKIAGAKGGRISKRTKKKEVEHESGENTIPAKRKPSVFDVFRKKTTNNN